MILPSRKTAAKVAISRFGETATILEPVDSDYSVDGYGKTSEEFWVSVGDETVVRVYERGAAEQTRTQGGRYRRESPALIFMAGSAIEEGYRVSYSGSLYEIDSLTTYPSHIEGETTSIN